MPRLMGDEFKARMAKGRVAAKARRAATGVAARAQPDDPILVPVRFVCNRIPALGLAVPSGLVSFDHGVLELTDPQDIAHIRKLPWYGLRIFEQEIVPEERPAGTAASAPEAAQASSPPAASSPHSPFRRFLRQAEQGGFRCGICDAASPYFPTEGAALNHLFHQHRNVTAAPKRAEGGADGPD